MIDTLARGSGVVGGIGIGSWLISLTSVLDPVLQFVLLLGSSIVVTLTAIIKLREVMRK